MRWVLGRVDIHVDIIGNKKAYVAIKEAAVNEKKPTLARAVPYTYMEMHVKRSYKKMMAEQMALC